MKNTYPPAPNLLPITRITSRHREAALRHWSFALVAIVLLVAIPMAMLSVHLRSAKPADTDHVTRFASDLRELQSVIPPLQSKLAQLQIASKAQLRAQSRIQWTVVMSTLAATTDEHIRIHSFSSSIVSNATTPYIEITIQTHTDTLSRAREYLTRLEAAGLFDEVTMLDSRRQSTAEDAPVNSTIRTRIRAIQPARTTP